MGEKTIIKTVDLPFGRDWEWFQDANVLALAPHLDEVGRERALCEVQAHWSCNRVVPTQQSQRETQPLAMLSNVAR